MQVVEISPVSRPAAIYQLLGYPGTGKYTVARALMRQLEHVRVEARLIDNQFIANTTFELVPVDGVAPLPPDVWERVRGVRNEILRRVEAPQPPIV